MDSPIVWILVLVGVLALLWVLFGALATSRRSRGDRTTRDTKDKRG